MINTHWKIWPRLFTQKLWPKLLRMKDMFGLKMLTITLPLLMLFTFAIAQPKPGVQKLTSAYLTEEDFNKYVVRFLIAFATIVGPLTIVEILNYLKNRGAATKTQMDAIQSQVHDIKILLTELKGRPFVSHAEVENIARNQAEKVLRLSKGHL